MSAVRSEPLRVAQPVDAADRELAGILRQRPMLGARLDDVGAVTRRLAAEHDQVEQRIRAEPIRAVHRHARRLADRHQARARRVSGSPFFSVTTSP